MVASEAIGPHGLRFDGAELAVRDPVAWDCHCDLDVLVQTMEQALRAEADLKLASTMGYCRALESVAPRTRRLLQELDLLCDLWQETGDLAALRAASSELLRRWPAESWQPRASVCGHAHIDLVWLWPEAATRRKIVHSCATVLRLLERYPNFVFTQSMPALYRMLQQDSPDLFQEVAAQIQAGRWEVLGGFEVEPDTNLPGGEALVRSLVVGQRKIAELTGSPSEIAWIPDVFGYSQCLPQIMALGGVKYFYTTKMIWSNITRFPYTSFVWRGADGTEVLAHLGTTDYNGEARLEAHEKALAEHRQAGVHPEILLPTGYGDGGGGPTETHLERVDRFDNLSGAPRTRWSRVDQFFARLAKRKPSLPTYQGELYLEYHRGTYTTQSEFKRLYRCAEQALQLHEGVRAALQRRPLPEEAWLRLLFAHFHDAIPGSSIQQVYDEMNPELAAIAQRETDSALAELVDASRHTPPGHREHHAFNALPYARLAVLDQPDGPRQVRLPALGSAPLTAPREPIHPLLEASATLLRHDRLTARFSPQGHLLELVIDGRPLELQGSTGFVLSPDDPVAFDAWDIDHHAARAGSWVAQDLKLSVVEHSVARAILQSEPVSIGQASQLQVRYILEAGSTHLKVEPTVSWHESHQLLRFVVPTCYRGRQARFGCPFGAIERPQLSGTEADEAMWEVPASRWAAVQYDGGVDGLALLAHSKLGYAAREGVLSVSLLRAPKWPDANADLGTHTMPLAIGRLQLETNREHFSTSLAADALFSPPLVYRGVELPPRFEWEALGSLNASWCAPAATRDDAYFIRLHETAGRPGTAYLRLDHPVTSVELVDLHEQPLETLSLDEPGRVAIAYRPWQILTLLVTGRSRR
jgi:alpha-mannosidase